MLIIIEKDKGVRKRLCDLLDRERILGSDSIPDAIEKVCKFRGQINVIISRIEFLPDFHSKQLVNKICDKLLIEPPSVVGYYTKDELEIKSGLEKSGVKFNLVEYNEQDAEFPEKFIRLILGVYPDLVHDINKAKNLWQRKPADQTTDFVDPVKWLKEEGFAEVVEKIDFEKNRNIEEVIPAIEEILKVEPIQIEETAEAEPDYKKLYLEMKQKHDQLSKYVQELVDFVKGL